MKRVSVPFLIGAMLFTVIGLYGCASDGERVAPVDASIGIIETRGTDETSRIVFYDGELNEVAQLSLRYANLGDVFHNPLVYQGSLFVIPQGRSKVRDGEAVLQVDVASLASKTHAIGRSGMNDVAVNDEYVFTCDSSCINRCRIDNGDVSKIAIEGFMYRKSFGAKTVCMLSHCLSMTTLR